MSASKAPASLRQPFLSRSEPAAPSLTATASVLSAVCMALFHPGVAAAQSTGAPAGAPADPALHLNTLSVIETPVTGPQNPYADPKAPYKADRSASDKRTQPLLDTPKSISVITKEQIQDSGATSLKDVMRTQPGVTLGTGEGGNAYGDRFIIRGFEARNDIFIDGLRDPGVISRESFAIEQVEISKGPDSTFAGRGTTGGAVNLVSKAAGPVDFTIGEATIGTDLTRRVTVDTNQTINEKVAVRLNGVAHGADVAGRDDVFDHRYGAALATRLRPSDSTTLSFDYYHTYTDSLPDWGVPFDSRTQQPLKVSRDTFYGLTGRDFQNTRADIGTAKAEVELTSRLRFSGQARYGVTGNKYVASAPESPNLTAGTAVANAKTRDQRNEYGAVQGNLIAEVETAGLKHTVVAGAEGARERITNRAPTVTPRGVTQNLYDPDPNLWRGVVTGATSTARSDIDSWAAYLMDTVEINPRWQVFGGARFDTYSIDAASQPTDYTVAPTRASNDSTFLNWHVGVVYKPLPWASLYTSYSTSSNPPGEQVDAGPNAAYGGLSSGNQSLNPERNRSIEIGTKWELFDGHLAVTGALFQTRKENALVSGAGTTVTQDGEARVRGFEVGAAGAIVPGVQVSGGYTLLDTEVTRSPVAANIGRPLPNVARSSLSAQAKVLVSEDWWVGGTATYKSRIYGGTFAAGSASLPSYWRFDAMAEHTLTDNVKLRLNVLNLTNATYYDAIYRSATPFAYVAPGRSALLTVEAKF